MKTRIAIIASLLATHGFLGICGEALPLLGTLAPRTAPDPKDDQWMIGCEVLDRDFTKFSEYKDYLPKLGIRSIRLQGGWAKCEKEKGKYDFAWLDEPVDFALAHGLNPVLETDYGNPIYNGGGTPDLAGGFPISDEALAAWDRWVDALSKHFRGRVRDWAMWNEPDFCKDASKGDRTPEKIAMFNVRTAKGILKNIPDARVAGLSLATNDPGFNEACFKAFGEDIRLFWRFIYHGYAPAPEESYSNVTKLKGLCAKYAPHATMWQGENGAPSEMPGDGMALNHIAWSEVSQAKWDMRRMLGDYVREIPSSVFSICDYYHPGFGAASYGLLRADSARNVFGAKCAFTAVRNIVTVFDSDVQRVPRKVSSPESSLQLWEFQRRGAPLFVFWTAGEWINQGGNWQMAYKRPSDSMEKRSAVIRWPGKSFREPVWVDLLTGKVYAFPRERMISCADGLVFTDVPVYDSPCIVTERVAIDVNNTVLVQTRIAALPPEGGTLRFEKGEYHFYEDAAKTMWLEPSNNQSGEKHVVFPLVGRRNVTIDGCGSTFVFHGRTFPFAATNCTGLAFRNFTVTTRYPSCAGFVVKEKDADGFTLRFDDGVCPYRVEQGNISFSLDGYEISTRKGRLSLHSLDRSAIHYLMTPEAPGNKGMFPSTFVGARAEDIGNSEVRFTYYGDKHPKCVTLPYAVGEKVVVSLEEGRYRDVFFFEDCDGVAVENVAIRRFGGMGIVGQRSGNVNVAGLSVHPHEGERVTLTADVIQFINCYGNILITGCEGGLSLDDWINIHGNYLNIVSAEGRCLRVQTQHSSQQGFFPYRPGDVIECVTPRERKVLATARVCAVERDVADPSVCKLTVDADLSETPLVGQLVENATLNPDVTIKGNCFSDFPHLRLSGRGKYVVESNRFERCSAAVLGMDLAGYWSESGRIEDMTIKNNVVVNGGGFHFGLTGWEGSKSDVPKVHGRIILEGNVFDRVRGARWSAVGVRDFVVKSPSVDATGDSR